MATYVNNLRLKEIATGAESGTWGTSTNTNLELIADAFGSGTEAITTNADTHTTTVADGAADEGRAIYMKYTGTLDSACTITLAPDTINKFWIIENATSGSQNIIISQGSGANITIGNGNVSAIFTDGAGGGAAVLDALADLELSATLTVAGAVTMSGDVSVGDDLTLVSDAAVLNFGENSDVNLTHVHDTGLLLNSTMQLQFNDSTQYINAPSAAILDINATDEIELNATAVDLNGTLDVSGTSTLTGTVGIGQAAGSGALEVTGGATIQGTTPHLIVKDSSTHSAGATTGVIYMQGLGSSGVNENLVSVIAQATASRYSNAVVQLSNGSGGVATALTLTGGSTPAATFPGSLAVTGTSAFSDDASLAATKKLYLDGGTDTYIDESSADKMSFTVGGTTMLDITEAASDTVVFTADRFTVSGVGPHAIGSGVSGVARLSLDGAFTSDGSSSIMMGINNGGALTGAGGDTSFLVGQYHANSIVTQTATEDIAVIAQAYFVEPAITDNLTGDITQAATVYIASAPTEGETNAALYVASGHIIHAAMANSDPSIAGALWNDSGTVKISSG